MKPEPRILVVSNYNNPINPIRPEAEIFVGLLELGFHVSVMTECGSDYAIKLEKLGANIIDYRPKKKLDFTAIALIRKCVSSEKINIVHAFNSKAILNSTIGLWCSNVKIVGYRGYTGNIKWYDPALYLSFLNPRLDYMVCLADSVRDMFIENGMSARKAVTIHKGHKAQWYDHIEPADLSEFDIPGGVLVFSLVANHRTKMKGIHILVAASALLAEHFNICFLLIGKGLDTGEILSQIRRTNHPDRFIFAGYRDDVSSLVKASDVSISASLFGEATQKAMIEAMYLGNPVIMTDISGNRNMAINGEGGLVIEPNNPTALAEAISWMVDNRSELEKMGQSAKAHISKFLSNKKTVDEYAKFYQRILE